MSKLRFFRCVTFAFISIVSATTVAAQYKGLPVNKNRLLETLRSRQLQSSQIVAVIKSNGVDFRVTPPVEGELVAAGARPEVVVAAKANYRGATAATTSKKPPPSSGPTDFDDFSTQGSVAELEKRVQVASTKGYLPYQQLGYKYLMLKNYEDAEKYMVEAMNRGGSGVFPVLHDHNGTFTAGCTGMIYVSRDGVQFESNTEVADTFGIPDKSIKEIKMNSGFGNLFRMKKGSFHIKLEGKNYNFAPVSGNSTESKLLIKLVGK